VNLRKIAGFAVSVLAAAAIILGLMRGADPDGPVIMAVGFVLLGAALWILE